jgi:Ca2+-binding RTX toxin-like protein
MLILQGNANGNNHLTVSPDPGGKSVYARANDCHKHYLLKDIQTIRIQGGEKSDQIDINKAIYKSSFIRGGGGSDSICGGSGSDTVFGENGNDSIKGGNGDDLLLGGSGSDKIDAGAGDSPTQIWQHKNAKNKVAVTSFSLINADTKAKIMELKDGSTLDLAKLPRHLNIVANVTKGGNGGSVRFSYDALKPDHIENAAPFAMAGDKMGEFTPWLPGPASTLIIRPTRARTPPGRWGPKGHHLPVINSRAARQK